MQNFIQIPYSPPKLLKHEKNHQTQTQTKPKTHTKTQNTGAEFNFPEQVESKHD